MASAALSAPPARAISEMNVYRLENRRGSRASVCNLGCALMALEIAGESGQRTDVVLGYDTPDAYWGDPYYFGVVVGRCAGRIAGGRLDLGGRRYDLPVAQTGHHLHGGRLGFGKRAWEVTAADAASISLRCHSPDGEEGYPGSLTLAVTYTLDDNNTLIVEYRANADQETVVSPTQHSYFNLAGHASGNVLGHEIAIDSEHYVPVDETLIPCGAPQPVAGTAMDFRSPRPLGDALGQGGEQLALAGGFDHSWELAACRDWTIRPAAEVREPNTGRELVVYTDRPALHFYSGNMMDVAVPGKTGALYDRRQGFCLETQHLPTPVFDASASAVQVSPRRPFSSQTRFEFSGF